MTPSTLRELSRAASPAPWRAAMVEATDSLSYRHDIDTVVETGDGDTLIAGMLGPVEMDDPNAALIVALRNDAEKYADLREAGRALAARLHEMYLGAETREKLAVFVAALDALDGSAP